MPEPEAILWLGPKPLPVIVIVPPTGASGGVMPVITGLGTSKELLEALETELTVTSIWPVLAPEGTVATICVSLQLVAVAATPLNVRVLLRWFAWNPLPLMVTVVPAVPPKGEYEVTIGGGTENRLVALL